MATEKQVVVAVEGTAAMGPFWHTILSDYIDKIIRSFSGSEGMSTQKISEPNPAFALVVFNAHGPYSGCLVQRSGWTKDIDIFFQWLFSVPFIGGGFSEAAIADGLSEALLDIQVIQMLSGDHEKSDLYYLDILANSCFTGAMLSAFPSGSQSQQNADCQKHCILIAASNPHPLPTPVPRPPTQNLDKSDIKEVPNEIFLADAETVAKLFPQNHISLSVFSPKQLPKLRAIYNAGKQSPRATDPTTDHMKNSQFLVLPSENFLEARAALSHPGIAILQQNQGITKVDVPTPVTTTNAGPPPSCTPAGNGQLLNRPPISNGNIPSATVKVEPATFSLLPPISTATSQGNTNLPNSAPSPASQEMNADPDSVQEFKPVVNTISQPPRPVGPATAKAHMLNSLSSQARNAMNSSIGGANTIGFPPMGGAPMAMHMPNMISSGMTSSALTGISSIPGSGSLITATQAGQNTAMTSFTSTPSQSGNSNISNVGISSSLPNIQSSTGMSQASLNSSSQMGQNGVSMNLNIMNGLNVSSNPSVSGPMIPTLGMSQQMSSGLHPLGATNGSTMNLPSQQHPGGGQQPRYVKIWEGALSGQRQGQPVFICKLEGYRNATASEKLAEDWPNAMQIVRLISQDHMNNKQYVGKADFLVFRTLNQHGFLGQLQEKKLCAVIQLPSQTLLLSVSDKASRLIGMLFPGDMVVFKPQISNQPQQLQQQQMQQLQQQPQQQQLQQQQQQPMQLQQQQQPMQLQQQQQQPMQLQQQQLQRQQMVSAGMSQAFGQGAVRPQMMQQGMMQQQGQGNLPGGGGFMP